LLRTLAHAPEADVEKITNDMNSGVSWVRRTNEVIRRSFVLLLLAGAGVGAAFPSFGLWLKDLEFFAIPFTPWRYDFANAALGLMMLAASVQCELRDFRQLRDRPRGGFVGLAMIYGVLPALVGAVGLLWVNLSGSERGLEVLLGLMMSALMPVAMTSSVWVRSAGGNLPLLLALIALTTGLSVLSVPLYLTGLIEVSGSGLSIPTEGIVQQLVISVTLPLVLGLGLRRFAPRLVARSQGLLSLLSNLALLAVVVANVAVALPHVLADRRTFAAIAALTVGLNLASYGVGLVAGRWLKLSREDSLTLLFGCGMRSNSTGLMIGLKGFPGMPLVAVPAALYMLTQHLIAAVLTQLLERRGSRLMGRSIALEARSLELFLARESPAPEGLSLVVFRVPAPGQLMKLVRRARAAVRATDFVCVLGPAEFGIVLVDATEVGPRLVIDRVRRIAGPSISARAGTARAGAARRLLEAAG
jgi:BASS family bile acid:Na+ symporter